MKPYVTIEWNDTLTDATGWLCIYNFVKGYAGGGTRMHPTVTKEEVIRLATGMAYKMKACESDNTGGSKGGIVYDAKKPDAYDVLKRYMEAMRPYIDTGIAVGSDLGTNYGDILKIFGEIGMQIPITKSQAADPVVQKGLADTDRLLTESIEGFLLNDAVTGFGVAFAADEAWKFDHKEANGARVVIQGFGCVGASCAYKLEKLGYKIVGIADAAQLVVCQDGLDVKTLMAGKNKYGEMDPKDFLDNYEVLPNTEWDKVDCDILIPAALEDVINKNNADKINTKLIVEAANIPISAEGDAIVKKRGIRVVPDFIANLGAVRFFDRVYFGLVEPTPESVIGDIEEVCRRNVQKLFSEAKKTGRYERELALEIFEPTEQSVPEC